MSYQVVLVEDEKHQQEAMLEMLGAYPDFQIVGVASSIDEGKNLIESAKPDLALLDVMISSGTSFDLLQMLDHIPFEIIFTTSYDHFAVQAFRLSAIDYLLKPIDKDELAGALEKFRARKLATDNAANIRNLLSNLQLSPSDTKTKIALPTLTGFLYVAIKDIVRCESDNTYTTFHTVNKNKIMVSKTLKEVEVMLGDYRFFRIHNSHLINLDFVSEYLKGEGGVVLMADGSHIDVSRRRKDEFLLLLKHR
ncbi:MAG: response regulator transcription factor [Bacteroidetes bacterium]|nr:response regulator transcription factor [Bacteroidota bacterium]